MATIDDEDDDVDVRDNIEDRQELLSAQDVPRRRRRRHRVDGEEDASVQVIAGRRMMSLETRQFISVLQLAAFLAFSAAAIMSLYDGVKACPDASDCLFDTKAEAVAAGVGIVIGDISKYAYLGLFIATVALATLARLWEWFVYRGSAFMGLDLTYNSVDEWSCGNATVRARQSFSPRGESYRRWSSCSWYSYNTCLALYILHIVNDRPANTFGGVTFLVFVYLLALYAVALWSTYSEDVHPDSIAFVYSKNRARLMTQHTRLLAREYGIRTTQQSFLGW